MKKVHKNRNINKKAVRKWIQRGVIVFVILLMLAGSFLPYLLGGF